MVAIRAWFVMLTATLMMFGLVGCSSSSDPASTFKSNLPVEKELSTAELSKEYDPTALIEKKTLAALPADLQSVLGVHATGYARLADVGEPCYPTDVSGDARFV
jgi:hypothetical protein